jgi:hypothetical protein
VTAWSIEAPAIGQILAYVDFLAQAIADVQLEIELRLAPFEQTVQLLQTIPGSRPSPAPPFWPK